jgi:hypothetical protein
LGGPELTVLVPVAGTDDLDHRAIRSGRAGAGRDGLVQRRVESGADVVAASEAKLLEHAHSLVMHGLDAGHDRGGIGIGVAERSLQVVHHWKP